MTISPDDLRLIRRIETCGFWGVYHGRIQKRIAVPQPGTFIFLPPPI